MKLHIKKGDNVCVLAGESKGQQGRVLEVQAAKQRAIVEGVNIVTKATKPRICTTLIKPLDRRNRES